MSETLQAGLEHGGQSARRLLGDGLQVSPIGLGTMGLSPGVYGAVTDDAAIALIHKAIEVGVTFFDTADVYGRGDGERLVGRAVAAHRDQVTLATKFGFVGPGQGRQVEDIGYRMKLFVDASPDYAPAAIDASLRRLGVDHVDLWYLHLPDPAVPIEETVAAMAEQITRGTVRHLGLCNVTAEQLRRAHRVHPITAVQCEYSLWNRAPEVALWPACRELGVGLVAWGPLGSGFLTDAGFIHRTRTSVPDTDVRCRQDRFTPDNLTTNAATFGVLTEIAAALGRSTAQLALAWLLARGCVPIPGTRRIGHLLQNLAASAISVPDEILAELDERFPVGSAAGAGFRDVS